MSSSRSPSGDAPSFEMGARFAKLAGLAGAMFGWRPDEFWAATPEELACLVRAVRGDEAAPPDLKTLMERFPDG